METAIIIVIVLVVAIYYGVGHILEKGAGMANREINHLDDIHMAAITKRTANIKVDLSDEIIKEAGEVKAKLAVMRKALKE